MSETRPHPEERPFGRVSKDGYIGMSWFETALRASSP
jgi:hypothetical protein